MTEAEGHSLLYNVEGETKKHLDNLGSKTWQNLW